MDILNYIFAALSIWIGAISWFAPAYAMSSLDMKAGETTMAASEVRASAGCLFVGLGVGALILGTPMVYMMLGFAWTGAAIGRLTSLMIDGQFQKKWVFFAVEAGVGIPAILINI